MAVIVVSSDLDEVLGLAHRVLVLARGEIKGEFAHGIANSQNVMDLAVH
jgi:ribose transport system ATP-binding protein